MIELISCPVCNNNGLVTLLSTLSEYDDSFRSHNVAILNHILKNVLGKDEVLIDTKQCRQCKQIFITPTFSPQEMARLYSEDGKIKMNQFYKKVQEKTGLSYYEDFSGEELLGKKYEDESIVFRRKFIFDAVTSFKKRTINKLLDIGGGDGNNILSFEKSKKYVFDLVPPLKADSQIEFINNINTAYSLAPFDLIVSTHTLEHIINSRETVASYAKLVEPGSLFYVEVPSEYARLYVKHLLYPILKKGMYINWHVNYFSPSSLLSLFAASGYKPLYLKTRFMPYRNLRMQTIIGLFVYTGVSNNYIPSTARWYKDFFKNALTDAKIKGFYKLFKRYPSLTSFN